VLFTEDIIHQVSGPFNENYVYGLAPGRAARDGHEWNYASRLSLASQSASNGKCQSQKPHTLKNHKACGTHSWEGKGPPTRLAVKSRHDLPGLEQSFHEAFWSSSSEL
jgi:hypothetical protein